MNTHPNIHPAASEYTNSHEIAVALVDAGVRATAKAAAKTKHHTMLLETRIKARASGRPGPRARTGNYRGSWSSSFAFKGSTAEGTVGTNAPQARRLEYGFVGADRIGRVFNQPPFPHVGPAVDETRGPFEDDMANIVEWGG